MPGGDHAHAPQWQAISDDVRRGAVAGFWRLLFGGAVMVATSFRVWWRMNPPQREFCSGLGPDGRAVAQSLKLLLSGGPSIELGPLFSVRFADVRFCGGFREESVQGFHLRTLLPASTAVAEPLPCARRPVCAAKRGSRWLPRPVQENALIPRSSLLGKKPEKCTLVNKSWHKKARYALF